MTTLRIQFSENRKKLFQTYNGNVFSTPNDVIINNSFGDVFFLTYYVTKYSDPYCIIDFLKIFIETELSFKSLKSLLS